MSRGRGRPPKDEADIALVRAVRVALAQGSTVGQACAHFRQKHGPSVGTAAQLQRRYERIAREYQAAHPKDPRLRVLARAFGILVRRKGTTAAALLTGRPHKKTGRQGTLH